MSSCLCRITYFFLSQTDIYNIKLSNNNKYNLWYIWHNLFFSFFFFTFFKKCFSFFFNNFKFAAKILFRSSFLKRKFWEKRKTHILFVDSLSLLLIEKENFFTFFSFFQTIFQQIKNIQKISKLKKWKKLKNKLIFDFLEKEIYSLHNFISIVYIIESLTWKK